MVVLSNTVVDPGTVVVHLPYAAFANTVREAQDANSTENQDENVLSIYKEAKRQHEIWDKLKKNEGF